MAEVHLLRRELGAALELYEGLVRDYPDSPKLWNERGVCLHQAGRRAEAVVSYERAVGIDSAYQLAWNNLGVVRAHEANAEAAVAAFRQALGADRPLLAARLNLGLLSFQRRQFRAALEEYQQALAEQPASAVAWNGVGLVLMELRRYEDARNAFGRAVDADPDFAAAHYNLSFVLSQLGDFDGALRETRRALELEPLYVPQKFALTIDLQYEDPTIAIAPGAGRRGRRRGAGRRVRVRRAGARPALRGADPGRAAGAARPRPATRSTWRATTSARGCSIWRWRRSPAPPRAARRAAAAAVLLGDIFAKRGLYGEALERYREARAAAPDDPDATLGEIRALLALGWASDAAPLADELARRVRGDVEVLVARARVRLAVGDALGALDCIREAQSLAPGRSGPAPPPGPGVRSAGRPLRRARRVQRRAPARSVAGPGLVRARRAGGGAGATGRRHAPPTSARSTCCRPTAPPRSRSPTCSAGASRPARRSRCWSGCWRPIPTSWRR